VRALDRLDVVGEKDLARRVEPVQVLEHGDAGAERTLGVHQALDQVQDLSLARLRIHPGHRAVRVRHGEEVEHQGQALGEALVEEQQLARYPLARHPVGVALADLEIRAQELEYGQQRDRLRVRLACHVVEGDVLRLAALHELVAEAALADAGLADDPDHVRLPRERLLQRMQFLVAADEVREAARARHVEPPAGSADAGQLVHPQCPAAALDLELAKVGEREVALHERRRVIAEIDPVGRGELLHALREAHRVADRRVGHREVLADRPDHHLARVEPHPHREVEPLGAAQLRRVSG
jgi:hypothetical protein